MSSSNNSHEPVYNQEDMDNVLAAVAKFKREAELSNQLLWAVVQAAGGHVKVPYQTWANGEPTREIAMWDDPITYEMNLQIVAPDEVRQ